MRKSAFGVAVSLACGLLSATGIAQVPYNPATNYNINQRFTTFTTWMPSIPFSDVSGIAARPLQEVKELKVYYDGLGRPVQTISKGGALEEHYVANRYAKVQKDLVSISHYDEFGLEKYKFLPFASNGVGTDPTLYLTGKLKLSPFTELNGFYSAELPGEQYLYSRTNFDNSTLKRPTEIFAPGNDWAGTENASGTSRKSVKIYYGLNTNLDAVRKWRAIKGIGVELGTVMYNEGPTGTYAPSDLIKVVQVSEDGAETVEFKDKDGRVILKKNKVGNVTDANTSGSGHQGWACTYYIYSDDGFLMAVAQPEAVNYLDGAQWSAGALNENTNLLDEQFFRYEYDFKGRNIVKKVPGAGSVVMLYDSRDRLVLYQDKALALTNRWIFTEYDHLNREIGKWLWTPSKPLETVVQENATSALGYPLVNGNLSEFVLMHKTYFDNYDFIAQNSVANLTAQASATLNDSELFSASSTVAPYADQPVQCSALDGLVTGQKVGVIGTSDFLYSVSFYDQKERVIQSASQNYVGGKEVATTQYDYLGKPIFQIVEHSSAAPSNVSLKIRKKFRYDGLDRVTDVFQKVTGSVGSQGVSRDWVKVSQTFYNLLGQASSKELHETSDAGVNKYLAAVNSKYNIRGWLSSINKELVIGQGNPNMYFGAVINYSQPNGNLGGLSPTATGIPSYSGNISAITWNTVGDPTPRNYKFTYDKLSRFISADFTEYRGGNWGTSNGIDFSCTTGYEPDAYDLNGNIRKMDHKGWKLGGSSWIDRLTYTYFAPNSVPSNRLKQVVDASNDFGSTLGDFKYRADTKQVIDYSYDVNGNMTVDNNKQITGIVYNYLNLPNEITFNQRGKVKYAYTWLGEKLKKSVEENLDNGGVRYTTTDYASGFIYESRQTTPTAEPLDHVRKLMFFGHDEGRVRLVSSSSSNDLAVQYDYMLKDHLGNVRVMVTDEQKTMIYPAATLEGLLNSTSSLVSSEREYYQINNACLQQPSMAGVSGYPYANNNGMANPNPNCSGTVCTSDVSQKMYKLNPTNNGDKIGLGITLKVMARDKISILCKSLYKSSQTSFTNTGNALSVGGILGAFASTPLLIGKGVQSTQLSNNGVLPANLLSFFQNQPTSSTVPIAFVNYIFFDEQFKYVSSGFEQVGGANQIKSFNLSNLVAQKNGFVYVYCSNESSLDVYFDNLQVIHTAGPILEETHYYPFGLTMSGISSKAAGSLENKRKFNKGSELQSKEFSDGSGLELYATNFRSLDPQLGRWWQIDPKPTMHESPYASMGNNPISLNDPLGDTIRHSFRTGFLGIFGKKVSVDYNNGKYNVAGTNTEYTGKLKSFGKSLLNDLTALSNNPVSSGVVTELQNYNQVIQVGSGSSSGLDLRDYINNGASTMTLNYNRGESVESKAIVGGNKDNSPSYVKLFHELAHALQFKQLYGDAAGYRASTNQSAYYGIWYYPAGGGTQIVNSEKFSTHYENMLRASIPGTHLREYYSVEGITPEPGRILKAGTRESLYHFIPGTTTPYVY